MHGGQRATTRLNIWHIRASRHDHQSPFLRAPPSSARLISHGPGFAGEQHQLCHLLLVTTQRRPPLCPRRPTSCAVISHTCGGPSMARRALNTGAPHAALPYIRSPKHDIRKNRQRCSTGACPPQQQLHAPAAPRQSPPLPGFIWTTRITGRRCAAAAAGPAAQQTARSPTAQPAPHQRLRARGPQAGRPAGC